MTKGGAGWCAGVGCAGGPVRLTYACVVALGCGTK